jgi:hypothetical protein
MLTGKMTGNFQRRSNNKDLKEELELPFFNMDELACATNNFSVSNKLGEGGFGPVYKVIIIYKQSCNIASEFSWYKLQAPVEFCGIEIIPQLVSVQKIFPIRHPFMLKKKVGSVVLRLFHYRTYFFLA